MNVKEADREYKRRFYELAEQLGHTPTVHDKEYWDLSEWHKSQMPNAPRDFTDEPVEPVVMPKRNSAEKPVARHTTHTKNNSSTITCRDCGTNFPRPIKRGRPPVKCEPCRSK